jgi:hypothetical protein
VQLPVVACVAAVATTCLILTASSPPAPSSPDPFGGSAQMILDPFGAPRPPRSLRQRLRVCTGNSSGLKWICWLQCPRPGLNGYAGYDVSGSYGAPAPAMATCSCRWLRSPCSCCWLRRPRHWIWRRLSTGRWESSCPGCSMEVHHHRLPRNSRTNLWCPVGSTTCLCGPSDLATRKTKSTPSTSWFQSPPPDFGGFSQQAQGEPEFYSEPAPTGPVLTSLSI